MDKEKLIRRQKEIIEKLISKPKASGGKGRLSQKHRKRLNEELREINRKLRTFPDYKPDYEIRLETLKARGKRKKKKSGTELVTRTPDKSKPVLTLSKLLEVEVLRKYRMVHFSGPEVQARAHYDLIEPHQSRFDIVTITQRIKAGGTYGTAFGKTTSGRVRLFGSSCTVTFGSDEGLVKYLEFNGWQNLPDKFECDPLGLD